MTIRRSGRQPGNDYERIARNALNRSVSRPLDPRTRAEVVKVESLVATVQQQLRSSGIADAARPSASLANPFLNDRAVRYWDSLALERWMALHGLHPIEANQPDNR